MRSGSGERPLREGDRRPSTRDGGPRSAVRGPVLLTGCAGFIGWKVAEHLLAEGYQVVGVDNLNDAYDVRLKRWRLARLEGRPGFTFHRMDICDRGALYRLFAETADSRRQTAVGGPSSAVAQSTAVGGPWSAVINLAARAGVRQSVEDPWVYYETNVTGTLNLLDLCREFGVRRFILASTSSLYGNADGKWRGADGGSRMAGVGTHHSPLAMGHTPFREDMATDRPLSPYAASKKAAEALCHSYHYLYGMDVAVLRYFTVYGPAGRPDMSIFRFVQWIAEGRPVVVYGDGRQSRDFTYVDDIARGTVATLHYLKTADDGPQTAEGQPSAVGGLRSAVSRRSSAVSGPVFEIINLGSDRPVVLLDVIRLVEEAVGERAQIEHRPRHPADVWATWADIGKAERLLGWRPQTPFEEGVRRAVAWYQEERGWAREVATAES
ncbi:MAG: GDP-mannose 4,6-dehydratase [Anaerolineae bacterium]|nr:GDP-mannose 4,6-dehydratase [Anaerolineae bacterium]